MHSSWFYSLFLFFILFSFSVEGTLPSSEVEALEDFYYATGGEDWEKADHWLQGDPCENNWYGVTCAPAPTPSPSPSSSSSSSPSSSPSSSSTNTSTVVAIALPSNNLQHTVSSLTSLPNLLSLSLIGNRLGGNTVSFLPFSVEYVDLSYNQMGRVGNKGVGNISSFVELVYFDVSHNGWEGQVDDDVFENKEHLTNFFVNDNHLKGTIPSSIINSTLNYLDMSRNSFTGTLPIFAAQRIYMSNNRIEGTIPQAFASDVVQILDLSGNRLNGTIPTGFSHIASLSLNENNFAGAFPNSLLPLMPRLEQLFLENNEFTGYPDNRLCQINEFDVSGNPFNCDKKNKFAGCCDAHNCGDCLVDVKRRIKWSLLALVLITTAACFGLLIWMKSGKELSQQGESVSVNDDEEQGKEGGILDWFQNLGSKEEGSTGESMTLMGGETSFTSN